ncbi:MAG: glycoside hydrolase family 18 protein [Planctomycetaceae bacterium]|nr:glycoside hydrolase family 18 protein [Planctomycetaceae bacterium]
MKPVAFIAAVALTVLTPTAMSQDQGPASNEFRIVGYLPDYRMSDFDLSPCKVLTDLYLFSAEVSPDGSLSLDRLRNAPWSRLQSFKTTHRVRLVLCIGGWDRSSGFGPMATSTQARKRFIESVRATCLEKRLDGIDIDWEHPQNEAEQGAYAQLLIELAESLHSHGLQVSVTMASWQTIPSKGLEAVDAVNIMSYDHDGRHSTFEAAQADIEKVITLGATPDQINLGVPFYGRSLSDRNKALTWAELADQVKPGFDEHDGVYFNGPETIRRKTRMAKDKGLGGVMIWELGQDVTGKNSLLTVIREEAQRRPAK